VPEGIDYAVMMIGANDFNPLGAAYFNIYNGAWSAAAITSYVNGILANINAALDTVLPTGVPLVLVNAPDYGVTPTVIANYPDASQRQDVADAISELNTGMEAIAMTRGLVYIDFYAATKVIFGEHASPNASISIGAVSVSLSASDTSGGGIPTAGFVDDGIHPNTTLQGIFANTILEALNLGFGAGLTLFTEEEILDHRGIVYGGSDTLEAQYGAYSDYITIYAGPSVPALSPVGVMWAWLLLVGTSFAVHRRGTMGAGSGPDPSEPAKIA
jgi:lysophospholipase L1-like esterase